MTEGSRFVASTGYTGNSFDHEYSVTAEHTPWKTTVTKINIEGVEDPVGGQASAEAGKKPAVKVRGTESLTVRLKLHRRTETGSMPLGEEIHVTSAVIGGSSERGPIRNRCQWQAI